MITGSSEKATMMLMMLLLGTGVASLYQGGFACRIEYIKEKAVSWIPLHSFFPLFFCATTICSGIQSNQGCSEKVSCNRELDFFPVNNFS